MKKLTVSGCKLCNPAGEDVLWQDDCCRIIGVDDVNYPGFCRVILHDHVREMSDLDPARRDRLMQAVFATESALRQLMNPDKINLASLGNMVPHLHWHVIPRFDGDRHFPDAIWAEARRPEARPAIVPDRNALAALLKTSLA